MIVGVLVFSIVVSAMSYLITKPKALDRGQLALYITLIAWGSLLFGLCLPRMPL
jgi:hypothetical protein